MYLPIDRICFRDIFNTKRKTIPRGWFFYDNLIQVLSLFKTVDVRMNLAQA